jgi:tetratricopeptide (TPR) repeat protein
VPAPGRRALASHPINSAPDLGRRTAVRRARAARVLLGLLAVAVCPLLGQSAETSPAPVADPLELLPVPTPDLSALEPAVGRQLAEMQQVLERELQRDPPSVPGLAEAYGELGRHYQVYGMIEVAAACYENARRLAPADFRWPYYLAYVQQQRGRLEDAAAAYVNALALETSAPALYHLAEIFQEQGRPHEARVLLGRILDGGARVPAADALLGQIALSEKRFREAVAHLQEALKQVPRAGRLHYSLGLAYRGLGELDEAQKELSAAGSIGVRITDPLIDQLEELKTGERVHLLRGQQAYRAGDLQAAIEAFRKAVEARPESLAAHVNLGSALGTSGDAEGAVAEFAEALRLDPDSFAAHFNLGVLLLGESDSEAIEHLTKAAELAPDDGEVQLVLARALRDAGRLEESLRYFAAAARLTPGDDRPWLGGADALFRLGRYGEALQRLEEAHRSMPQGGRIAAALARQLAASPEPDLRDGSRALDLAQRVYDASPTASHAETMALAMAELGRCEEAARWQRKALAEGQKAAVSDRAGPLQKALAAYEQGTPCRPPVQASE